MNRINIRLIFDCIIFFLKKYYVLLTVCIVGLISNILPFITSNNLESFDHIGQYASVFYVKNFFWPWPDGWNSMMLSGFPQGLFYPPFFHWLTALLGFFLNLNLSYKIILTLAIFLFPIVIFVLAKKLFRDYLKATAIVVIVSIIYYPNLGLNDNLFSDIYYGMSTHLFSLTLFFIYLYSLFVLIKDNRKWYLSSLMLALLVVTHVISASAAIFFGFILLILSWNKILLRKNLLKHFLFALLLSIWWVIPFLLNIKYVSGSDVTNAASTSIILVIPFILLLSLDAYRKNNEEKIFFQSICVFNFFILVIYLCSSLFSINNFPIHFSRLLIYPFLLFPFLIIYFLDKKDIKLNWQKINLALLFCFFFYFFFLSATPVGPFDTKILNNIEKYWDGGRVIVSGSSIYQDGRFHVIKTKLAIEHNLPIAGGLFTESSSNGWFMMSLVKSWDENDSIFTFTWAYTDLKKVVDLGWGARIFGINYEYRIQDQSPILEEKNFILEKEKILKEKKEIKDISNIDFKINKIRLLSDEKIMKYFTGKDSPFYYQTFYKVNNTSLAEALNIRPINIKDDWQMNIRKWWTTDWLKLDNTISSIYDKPILVNNIETKDWSLMSNKINLPFIQDNKKMDSFIIDASILENIAPIYIKVEYFPYWHAYDQTGKKLEIYKASPNFMLVYGRGKIIFRYIKPWYYYGSYVVAGMSLLFLVVFWIKNKKNENINIY